MDNEHFKDFLENLKFTLQQSGGFGLAAPQVGVNLRIIALQIKINSKTRNAYKNMEEFPLTIMINPKITFIEGEQEESEYEGCLSIPQIRGKVKRPIKIFIEYYTPEKNKIQRFVQGYLARLIQHECDHLDGILFVDKVEKGTFATKKTLKEFSLK